MGRPLPRAEDDALLRGRAEFVDDIRLPDTLHVAFHRSPIAHAALGAIDTKDAASLPGVHAVLTSEDLGESTDLWARLETPERVTFSPRRPLLARGVVRFVGEAVVAALAESRYVAEDACERVLVDYEPLPVVPDVDAALAPSAAVLHPVPSNVLYEHAHERGGVDEALAASAVVIERTFKVARYAAAPLEPRGVLAAPTRDGVQVWTSTQAPHQLQRALVPILGLESERVRVTCPWVGGGFGQKAHVYPEEILVPLLALRYGRPVKWTEDRRENLIASSQARGQVVTVRLGATADGRLTALDADILCDMGAYGVYPHGHLLEVLGTPIMISGPYKVPAVRFRARAVATNKCPGGAFRGVGLAVAAFVHERAIDIVANRLGLDPADVRLRNSVQPGELPFESPTGMIYDSGDYPRALAEALERIGHRDAEELRAGAERRGRLFGVGHAFYVEYTGIGSAVFQGRGMVGIVGFDDVRIAVNRDGTATVWSSLPTAGQGIPTTLAQIVADELHLPPDRVTVAAVDTSAGADGTGTFASRSAIIGGAAAMEASETLRARLLELTSSRLEIHVDDLEFRTGAVGVRGVPATQVTYAELAEAAPEGYLDVVERYDPPETAYSYGAHACMVEVDPETGGVEILRYAVVEDCGRIINPTIVEGQTHGATAQGIGACLLESVVYDESGQPLTTSFMDYLVPSAHDVPTFDIGHLEHRPRELRADYKGVGEGGVIGGGVALANALSDALGVELNEIPVSPETIAAAARKGGRR